MSQLIETIHLIEMIQIGQNNPARLFPANTIIYNHSSPLGPSFLQGGTWLAVEPQKSRV
jgi:hypothetical protein